MNKITEIIHKLPLFSGKKLQMNPVKLFLLRILCLLLTLTLAAAAFFMTKVKQTTYEVPVYNAKSSSSAEYDITLNENSFFSSSTLKMGRNYIRSLVKSINIVFGYDLATEGAGETTLSYTVNGEMSTWYMESNHEKLLWSSSSLLSRAEEFTVSGSDCSISIPVSIDQSIYAAQLQAFQTEMDLEANGYYDITFTVNATYKANGEARREVLKSVVSIPLNGKVFSPTVSVPNKTEGTAFTLQEVQTTPPNWKAFGILTGFSVLCLIALIILLICFEPTERDAYLYELRTKIATVEDRIAYIQNGDEYSNDSIMLNDFESIVHIADERILPILCARDDVARTAAFFVAESSQKFCYVFDESKIGKDENDNSDDEE